MEDQKNIQELDDDLMDIFAESEEVMEVSNEQLKEMNKKLPKWSLEPPSKYLK